MPTSYQTTRLKSLTGTVKHYLLGSWRSSEADPGNVTAPTVDAAAYQTDAAVTDGGAWQSSEAVSYSYQWLRDSAVIGPLPVNNSAPSIALDE